MSSLKKKNLGKHIEIYSFSPLLDSHKLVVKLPELIKYKELLFENPQKSRTPPEKIVERGKRAGKTDKEIASEIDKEWTEEDRLTNEKMGRLLPASPGAAITQESHIQRGKRLRGKKT